MDKTDSKAKDKVKIQVLGSGANHEAMKSEKKGKDSHASKSDGNEHLMDDYLNMDDREILHDDILGPLDSKSDHNSHRFSSSLGWNLGSGSLWKWVGGVLGVVALVGIAWATYSYWFKKRWEWQRQRRRVQRTAKAMDCLLYTSPSPRDS